MFFLHLLVHKTIQFFIPEISFLFRYNSWKCLLFPVLFLIKKTAQFLFSVLSCVLITYLWFLLQNYTLLLVLLSHQIPAQFNFLWSELFLILNSLCCFCLIRRILLFGLTHKVNKKVKALPASLKNLRIVC